MRDKILNVSHLHLATAALNNPSPHRANTKPTTQYFLTPMDRWRLLVLTLLTRLVRSGHVPASPAGAPTMTLFRTQHQNHHDHSPNLSFTPPTPKRKGGVAFLNPPLEYFTALTANYIHSTSSVSLSAWNDITPLKPTSSIDDYAAGVGAAASMIVRKMSPMSMGSESQITTPPLASAAKALATSPSITPKELDSARRPLLAITTHKSLPISASFLF
ncbi:hypothetical protein MGU_04846 [Metarhizium guizhouense ARSEF 977]|uniref:Uncharacterized protein n=1 Tax=Metarhizium guizhouense (strain ARSEF 977) TaxID=1276136 RepID=A0A0B4H7M0_METGA|nr:hypothetical protein MGU_04846 [Metarhizium guizhouense ARSEF 977]